MSTPAELYNSMVEAARAEQERGQAEAAAAQAATAAQGLSNLTSTLQATADGVAKINERLNALEAARQPGHQPAGQPQGASSDPLKAFEDTTGIPGAALGPVVNDMTRAAAEKVFDEKLGPMLREMQAVQGYQAENADFDLNRMQAYLAKNPDVAKIVQGAAANGAYGAGIAYAETRRQLDERIAAEAKGQVRREKRADFVNTTRPDAQVVGAGGTSNPNGLNVGTQPLSAEKIQHAFAHLNAGNSKPFIDAFHLPNLPSEEEFQRMVQGPLA